MLFCFQPIKLTFCSIKICRYLVLFEPLPFCRFRMAKQCKLYFHFYSEFIYLLIKWNLLQTTDLQKLFPLSIMETGHDIIFFWVARMAMMSLELVGKLPFQVNIFVARKTSYFHSCLFNLFFAAFSVSGNSITWNNMR